MSLTRGTIYIPSEQTIRHTDAMLKLLSVMTNDKHFEQIVGKLKEVGKKEGAWNMCRIVDQFIEQGRKEGVEKGRKEGEVKGIKALVKTLRELQISGEIILQKLMEEFHLPEEQAKSFL